MSSCGWELSPAGRDEGVQSLLLPFAAQLVSTRWSWLRSGLTVWNVNCGGGLGFLLNCSTLQQRNKAIKRRRCLLHLVNINRQNGWELLWRILASWWSLSWSDRSPHLEAEASSWFLLQVGCRNPRQCLWYIAVSGYTVLYLTVLSTGYTVYIQIFIRFDSDRMLVTEFKKRKWECCYRYPSPPYEGSRLGIPTQCFQCTDEQPDVQV